MNSKNKRLPPLKDWATKQLGAKPGDSSDTVRKRFLEQLSGWNYVPPSDSEESLRYLQSLELNAESLGPPSGALFDEEVRLRQEVERYADGFFTFSVTSRKQKWILLFSRCSWHPALAAWLNALKPGLSIDLTKLESAPVPMQRLISRLCFLFTLRPPERAFQRREILQAIERGETNWAEVAKQVCDEHPGLADLDRSLIDAVRSDENLGESPPQDTMKTDTD